MFAFLPQETRNRLLSLPRVTIVVNIRKNRIWRDNDWGKTPSLSPFSLLSYSTTEEVKVPFHSAPFQYWRFLGFMVQNMIEDFTIRWSITIPNNVYFGAKFSNFFHFKGKQLKINKQDRQWFDTRECDIKVLRNRRYNLLITYEKLTAIWTP